MSTREVILIKIKNKTKTLNEFLNIKNIEDNYLTTLDGQVILFIKICPINTELFSEEELENKMNSMSIEFSNEQYPYTFFIIPRKVDIADFVNEQQELKRKLQDDVGIQIVEKRIICTHELVADKNIIENEFYLCIWIKDGENAIDNLLKRANNWKQRFKNCDYETEILNKSDIILMIKSFTIPEFARKEGTDYRDNIVRIGRKFARVQQNL
mgnify:FL=1